MQRKQILFQNVAIREALQIMTMGKADPIDADVCIDFKKFRVTSRQPQPSEAGQFDVAFDCQAPMFTEEQ